MRTPLRFLTALLALMASFLLLTSGTDRAAQPAPLLRQPPRRNHQG